MVEVLQQKVVVLRFDVGVAAEGLADSRVLQHDEGHDDVRQRAPNQTEDGQVGQLFLQGHLAFVEEEDHEFLRDVGEQAPEEANDVQKWHAWSEHERDKDDGVHPRVRLHYLEVDAFVQRVQLLLRPLLRSHAVALRLVLSRRCAQTAATPAILAPHACLTEIAEPLEAVRGEDTEDDDHADGRAKLLVPGVVEAAMPLGQRLILRLLDGRCYEEGKADADALEYEDAEELYPAVSGDGVDPEVGYALREQVGHHPIDDEDDEDRVDEPDPEVLLLLICPFFAK